MSGAGLIIAAPSSGSGKTVLTLGLLRHLARSEARIGSAKVGPDYIDPAFHAVATGRPCQTLDPWAMTPAALRSSAARTGVDTDLIICEGVMGLFDGATASSGSTADVAAVLGWPVILVMDVHAQAASAAAVLRGFVQHRADVNIAGTILNRVGSDRHVSVIREAIAATVPEVTVLGSIPRTEDLALPERHLGLVQAREHRDLDQMLERAADVVGRCVDMAALCAHADWSPPHRQAEACVLPGAGPLVPPLGQRIAVADDTAFAFRYPHVVDGWHVAGACVLPFSPLADEGPDPTCDAVYLPGGYPELYAGQLAGNERFLTGLRSAAAKNAAIFGECGGYMVLGDGLTDADGCRHTMAGLLPVETSFADRRLHLGYRRATLAADGPFGARGAVYRGHEFHYARVVREGPGQTLFFVEDARGIHLGGVGLVSGSVSGSFVHVIAAEAS